MGSAVAGGAKAFQVAGAVTLESTLGIDVDVLLSTGITMRQANVALFVHESVVGPGANASRKGLYGFKNDGTVSRLGFFTDSSFDPSTVAGGYTTNNLASPDLFQVGISGAGTVNYESRIEVVGGMDGNMDPVADGDDAIVCYEDRAILYNLIGTVFMNASYLPQADLDLDGDTDTADLQIFNSLPCNANWDCSTTSPVLNTADFTAYLQSFSAADPVADIDGSGNLDVADYTAFLQAYAVGCH